MDTDSMKVANWTKMKLKEGEGELKDREAETRNTAQEELEEEGARVAGAGMMVEEVEAVGTANLDDAAEEGVTLGEMSKVSQSRERAEVDAWTMMV